MLFDTWQYWLFFALAVIGLAALKDRPSRVALVALSYLFYGVWDWRFCFLLAASTVANYLFGLWIERHESRARKQRLAVAIAFNLGVLAFFKYYNFFIDSFAALLGLDPGGLALNILLPVGVSFFTFEGIAYAVDVYRRDLKAVRSPIDFALFISFFPHLVAGPIIRPAHFFPQIQQRSDLSEEDARWGLREILKGLFKKVVLADYFAPIADAWFSGGQYQGLSVAAWIGVFAFSMQIYFDFSGYTDIARGCARLLGYRFPPNFSRPYLAADITDFWRRWHISLSTWLRDYLYIPLGGNRGPRWLTYRNILIVMGLGGLWHGASWNFALWGLAHGGMLIGHRLWRDVVAGLGWEAVVDSRWLQPFWIAFTFVLVSLAWIPFRAPDLDSTIATFRALTQASGIEFLAANTAVWFIPLATLSFCLLDSRQRWQDWLTLRASRAIVVASAVVLLLVMEVFAQIDTTVPFVYFQF